MNEANSRGFDELANAGLGSWCDLLRQSSDRILSVNQHGDFNKWQDAISQLPQFTEITADLDSVAVKFEADCTAQDKRQIRESLLKLHPWRKGPFDLCGVFVDAEWRSNMKWNRVRPHVNWEHKKVLDVGCGNGYYGWRILGQGASMVLGLEPYPLYNAQFAAISKLSPKLSNFVVPASDEVLEPALGYFDIVLSMGVLYHSRDPIGHLGKLRRALNPGGTVVLETLVVDGDIETMLLPQERYAKMRNVWFIPSTLLLERMIQRIGFRHVEVVDITKTTTDEQRSTNWMSFESLGDFLDPHDTAKTIEGLPAPQRAIVLAS